MATTSDRGAALLLGTLIALTVVGSSAVAVAIPVVRVDLGLSVSDAAWIFAVFSLCFSVATAAFGRVSDLVGLRTPLVVGVGLMAVGSVVVGVAPSLAVLLIGRLVQGIGAGAVPVLVNGIVAARWQGRARTRMFGSLLAVVAVVSGSGPVVGGGVEALLGWRWVFALPALGVVLIAPIARLAPAGGRPGRFDVAGAIATALVIAGVLGILQAPTAGTAVGVTGGVLLAVGVPAEVLIGRARPDGFLPRRVITDPEIMRAALATLALLASYFAMLLLVPELLSTTRGWSPLRIGVTLLPAAAAGAIASRVAGRVAPTVGRQRTAAAVTLVTLGGLAVAAAVPTSVPALVAGMAGASIGFAASQAVLVDHVSAVTPAPVQGAALGVFNMVTFVGGSVGPAIVGGLSGVAGLPLALAATMLGPVGALALLRTPRQRGRDTLGG